MEAGNLELPGETGAGMRSTIELYMYLYLAYIL